MGMPAALALFRMSVRMISPAGLFRRRESSLMAACSAAVNMILIAFVLVLASAGGKGGLPIRFPLAVVLISAILSELLLFVLGAHEVQDLRGDRFVRFCRPCAVLGGVHRDRRGLEAVVACVIVVGVGDRE